MKVRQFESLHRSLLLQLEGFVAKRTLVFKPPLRHLLRGFAFEGSSFDKDAFYVNAFVMPSACQRTICISLLATAFDIPAAETAGMQECRV